MKPVIHTTLVVAVIVSMAFLISLISFNFVVLKKMNEIQPVLELFPDNSHMSKLKQNSASKIVAVINQKRQLIVTTQTLGVLILFILGVRLCVFFSCFYRPQEGSKFSFLRRPYEEIQSVFEGKSDEKSSPTGPAEEEKSKV